MKQGVCALYIIICICCCTLLSGCGVRRALSGNERAIEQIRLVDTLGVDSDGRDGVTVSAALAEPGGEKAQAQPESGQTQTALRCGGETLPQALQALRAYAGRGELFFAHTQFLVFSEDYAAAQLPALLDLIERDNEMRLGIQCFLLKGGEAAELLTNCGGEGVSALLAALELNIARTGESQVTSVRELVRALNEDGAALVSALRLTETEGRVFPAAEGVSAVSEGYAILRGAQCVGYLTDGAARAAALLTNAPGAPVLSVENPAGGRSALELEEHRCRIRAHWVAGEPEIEITLEADAVLAAAEGTGQSVLPADEAALAAALEEELRREALAAIDALRDTAADFLGLGAALRRADAAAYAARGGIDLQTLPITLKLRASIAHNYDLGDTGAKEATA